MPLAANGGAVQEFVGFVLSVGFPQQVALRHAGVVAATTNMRRFMIRGRRRTMRLLADAVTNKAALNSRIAIEIASVRPNQAGIIGAAANLGGSLYA